MRDGDKTMMRTIADSTVETILKVDEDAFLASHFSALARIAFDEHRCVARDERDERADYLVGLICFMFELVYPASRALAREQGDIHRLLDALLWHYAALTDPRHAGNLEPPKGRDARLADARLALKLSQQLLNDLNGIADDLILGSTEDGASGSSLMATMHSAPPMPARCWIAPETPMLTPRSLGETGYTRLANLVAILQPACLHNGTRATKLGTQGIGELSHQGQILLEPMPRPPAMTRRSASATGLLSPPRESRARRGLNVIRKHYLGNRLCRSGYSQTRAP